MCGIAGHAGPAEIPPRRIEACLALMRRRGPDHAAAISFAAPNGRRVDLLHARLSIIDLDPRSNQPFRSGTRLLAHNGEIYNYVELREGLRRRGVAFTTESDTEVLARGLEADGPAFLDGCEGMWAFARLDEADGSLLLSRDRFGEKPLYLHRDGADLYFASEPKMIAALLGRPLRPNVAHLRRYLVNGYKALYKTPETFFEGLRELPPASVLRLDASGVEREERYWRLDVRPDESITYESAVAGVRDRLVRSVGLRLRADVPLAFCMSGGVDSNALIGAAKRLHGHDVHGFTISTGDPRYEEGEIVAAAVRDLGIRHTTVRVRTDGFLARLRGLVRYHDAPVATITYYAHFLLQEAIASEGYRISVSGTAADEIFSGYYDHHLAYLREVRADAALHAAARAAWERRVRPHVMNPFLSDPDLFVRDPSFRGHIFLQADDFAAFLTEPFSEPFEERTYAPDLLRCRMMNELHHESVPVILHEDDLNAMYHSIENRSPYLDRDLVEYAYTVPTRHLVRDGYAKALLRDAARGLAPDAVLDAPRKVGFNLPVESCLDAAAPAVRAEVLGEGPVWGVVRRDRIAAMLDGMAGRTLPNSESKFLFNFLNAKIFLEEFS